MAKIRQSNIDESVITGNTELSASAATDDVLLVYDTSAGVIKKIQASNVGLQAPAISSISPTNVLSGDGTGNYTFTITGSGFSADVTAKLVTDGGTDISFDSVTRNSATQLTCVVAKNTANLTNANEPFDVTVTTLGALTTTSADAITIDASPVFVTASGSLGTGTGNNAESFSVNATDPESAGNVTFELQSGSLPPGLSLSQTGADGGTAIISGTATDPAANTTYNFTLRAVDAASNTTSRAFSITINKQIQYQTFTASGTFSVPSGMTSLTEVLVVAGGGGGGRDGGGGGGAGGLLFFPCYPVTPGGTITVTVGCGGQAGSNPNPHSPINTGDEGQDSTFGSPGDPGLGQGGVLITKGGGGGMGGPEVQSGSLAGNPGGSGGGGNGHGSYGTVGTGSAIGGTATQPTQPGNSGAYGFGNAGGNGRFTGQTPQNHLSGGGGGGAGAAGSDGSPNFSLTARGGIGRAYTIADGTTPVYYAGGGAGETGGVAPGDTTRAQGGGGTTSHTFPTVAGLANRGGGGGAGGPCAGPNGTGGKGVVIVKY
jgi:hypothetical protein